MADPCTHPHPRSRSRFATPLAIIVAAVVLSGGSAYAAAKITGAQIKDGTVTTADIKNQNLTGLDIKNGSVGGVDLAPGLANKLIGVRTTQSQSADLAASSSWQWTMPTSKLYTGKILGTQKFTVNGIIGYKGQEGNSWSWDVAICKSVNGGEIVFAGPTYGTITTPAGARFNVPVQAEVTAGGVTLRLGPCIRGVNAPSFASDTSSMTVLITKP